MHSAASRCAATPRTPARFQPVPTDAMAPDAASHEWAGYIPFDQLPQVTDPPDNVLATANARITPDGYRPSPSRRTGWRRIEPSASTKCWRQARRSPPTSSYRGGHAPVADRRLLRAGPGDRPASGLFDRSCHRPAEGRQDTAPGGRSAAQLEWQGRRGLRGARHRQCSTRSFLADAVDPETGAGVRVATDAGGGPLQAQGCFRGQRSYCKSLEGILVGRARER